MTVDGAGRSWRRRPFRLCRLCRWTRWHWCRIITAELANLATAFHISSRADTVAFSLHKGELWGRNDERTLHNMRRQLDRIHWGECVVGRIH
jgi:hypothetical protein